MASTYSSNLKLELMGTGDQSGTWGDTTNNNLGTLLEQAIVGYTTQTITNGADTVLTISNGVSSTARNYILELTGALSANRNLIVPAIQKSYIIYNNTTGGFSVTVKVSGQTGVTIASGKKAIVYNNGTDIIEVVYDPVTQTGTQTLTNKTLTSPVINGGTISGAAINSTTIGASTPSTGAFTTLSASSTVSGTGFSNYFASPPAIGGSVPAAGSFTTLSASSTVSGTGFSNYLASPPAIGGSTPAAGTFTTLTATTSSSRILPRSSTTASASSLTPNSNNIDEYTYSALAAALTINADTGTPVEGQKLIFRVLDNGTSRVVTFTGGVAGGFAPVGVTVGASGSNWTYSTTASKRVYFGCIYNATASRWDIVAIAQEA